MKRMDRLSGDEMARLGALFDAHPQLGVVWATADRKRIVDWSAARNQELHAST